MTREEYRRREAIIGHMLTTARRNGKETNWLMMSQIADRLHRVETTLSRLAEDECNYSTYDKRKQESREKFAEDLISKEIGCKCYTQRDPRGYCIRMYLVDENGNKWFNTWDGETTGLAW